MKTTGIWKIVEFLKRIDPLQGMDVTHEDNMGVYRSMGDIYIDNPQPGQILQKNTATGVTTNSTLVRVKANPVWKNAEWSYR